MTRPGGRLRALAVALGLVAASACPLTLSAAPADASTLDGAGCSTVYAGPHVERDGSSTGYFRIKSAAGTATTQRLVVTNPSSSTCTAHLQTAVGMTAANSGNSYAARAATACAGPACWLHGVPATVRVGPHGRATVPFTVDVPPGAAPGQYLAGVLVSSDAVASGDVAPGRVQMRIRTRVGVGVGVQVDGPLVPALVIRSVTLDTSTPPSRTIRVVERNTGNTWEHPSGTFSVRVGPRTVRLPLVSSTVLSRESATLSLGAEQVSAGTYPARVELHYANGTKTAVWSGDLVFGEPAHASKQGSTVVLTEAAPGWSTALLAALGVVSVVLLLLVLLLLRRRRSDRTSTALP